MKVKRIFAAMLMLVSFLSGPINTLALSDYTETVSVSDGQSIKAGNITVEGATCAANVYASQFDASLDVSGNVSIKSETSGTVISVQGNSAAATVDVAGDVTGESDYFIYGISASGSATDAIKSTVSVGGDVSVSSDGNAIGVDSTDVDVTVGKDIIVDGENVVGVRFSAVGNSEVNANSINATGTSVTGAFLTSYAEGEEAADMTLNVAKDIVALASSETYGNATGIDLINNGGEIHANVEGNVEAYAGNDGEATGIRMLSETLPESIDRQNNVYVGGDIISDGYGIFAGGFDSKTKFNVVVNGTISANKSAILLEDNNFVNNNFDLTAWQILSNDNGNYAERITIENDKKVQVRDQEFEKNINYIIKTDKITGAKIRLEGTSDKNGIVTAKAGAKVTLKIDLEENYSILGAYNGLEEKVGLLQDDAGNYYVIVPNGGGVLLSLALAYVIPTTPVDATKVVTGIATNRADGGVLGVRVEKQENKEENKENETLPGAAEATTFEDETLAGVQGADDGAPMWWVWSLIVLASAAGYGVYKYADTKKKAANTNGK